MYLVLKYVMNILKFQEKIAISRQLHTNSVCFLELSSNIPVYNIYILLILFELGNQTLTISVSVKRDHRVATYKTTLGKRDLVIQPNQSRLVSV